MKAADKYRLGLTQTGGLESTRAIFHAHAYQRGSLIDLLCRKIRLIDPATTPTYCVP